MKDYKLKPKVDSEEWELAPEEPKGVGEIQKFFTAPDPDKEMEKIAFKTLSPELLEEYKAVKDKLEALQGIQKHLRDEIVRLSGGEPGAYQKGKFCLVVKPRQGAVKVNFEKFIEDEMGAESLAELMATKDLVKQGKATSKYAERGEGGVTIEVTESK